MQETVIKPNLFLAFIKLTKRLAEIVTQSVRAHATVPTPMTVTRVRMLRMANFVFLNVRSTSIQRRVFA